MGVGCLIPTVVSQLGLVAPIPEGFQLFFNPGNGQEVVMDPERHLLFCRLNHDDVLIYRQGTQGSAIDNILKGTTVCHQIRIL